MSSNKPESQNQKSFEEMQSWLITELSKRLGIAEQDISPQDRFSRYGLTSAKATSLIADLANMLERPLSPTLVWDHPNIESLAGYLVKDPEDAHEPMRTRVAKSLDSDPIAVIGLACRFPGAPNSEAFWRLLSNGVDAIDIVPQSRWDVDAFYDPDITAPGKMNTRWGGFLEQVDQFDPHFFGISPIEAIQMDPQQRIMLELAWEALEDAGILPEKLRDSQTGVFVGAMWSDYSKLLPEFSRIFQHTATGHDLSIIPARISYMLGLQGPSIAINTACSSSLVSVHLACRSLQNGESSLALAGGVNLIISPESSIAMSKFGAMSPDGRSKAFDARANGYVRGEGAGIVILKPLSHALAAGDPIYCVIRGSAVNNDGFSNGLTAPNPQAQEAVLRHAYKRANIDPGSVHYIETHGPGTILGDPIEARALGTVMGQNRPKDRPLIIGSVKTNIGHLEAAAGIAGLTKLVLSIKNRQLPPTIHFIKPNPHIPFRQLRLKVHTKLEPWPYQDELALAGINSFGFGGTNCHMILEEMRTSPAQLFPLSADNAESLQLLVPKIKSMVNSAPDTLPLESLCYTSAINASSQPYRVALTIRSQRQLLEQLNRISDGRITPLQATADHKLVFVCSGQGSQWLGMGKDLLADEPVFRAKLQQCDQIFSELAKWSLINELIVDDHNSHLNEIDVIQPVLFALQVSLAALWQSWGITPDAVVGHSMGEAAAAYISGALSLQDAVSVIHHRSRLLKQTSGQGGMAVVELAQEKAEAIVAAYEEHLAIAAYNSPNSIVLSGDPQLLQDLLPTFEKQDVSCRMVKVDVASHSPQMDRLRKELFQCLSDLQPNRTSIPLISTVTASFLDGRQLHAGYWVRNLREPVLFAQATARLLSQGYNTFIELSAHPVLTQSIEKTVAQLKHNGTILASLQREEDARTTMLESLGSLYVMGQRILWYNFYSPGSQEVAALAEVLPKTNLAEREARDGVQLLTLSAHTPEALWKFVKDISEFVTSRRDVALHDICYTASMRRTHHEHRLATVLHSRDELIRNLQTFLHDDTNPMLASGHKSPGPRKKIVFVFSGQGSQWLGMARQLLQQEPVFRNIVEQCDALLASYSNWSIIEEFRAEAANSRLEATNVAQPAIFVLQVGLAALWRSWGVVPDAVVGHSVGEIAAAYIAGVLTLEDAIYLVFRRGQLMQVTEGQGKMVSTELTADNARQIVEGYERQISLAAFNSPTTTVLAGDGEALDKVTADLQQQQISHQTLPVNYAFHSRQMDPLLDELERALQSIKPRSATIPIYSTVTGRIGHGWEFDATYWRRNVREPVQFAPAITNMAASKYQIFLEISGHPVLNKSILQCLEHAGKKGNVWPSLRRGREERAMLLSTLGNLYTHGYPINWQGIYPAGRFVHLPSYPWQRKPYWRNIKDFSSTEKTVPTPGIIQRQARHPLLGHRLYSPLKDIQFSSFLDLRAMPFLQEHCVSGMVVFPAAAYLVMALAAAEEVFSGRTHAVENMVIGKALVLSENTRQHIHLVLTPENNGDGIFRIFSSGETGQEQEPDWKLHATGRVCAVAPEPEIKQQQPSFREIQQRCEEQWAANDYYQRLGEAGLQYGTSFRCIDKVWRRDGEALGEIRLPQELQLLMRLPKEMRSRMGKKRLLPFHPIILDASFQTFNAAFPQSRQKDTYLPMFLEKFCVYRDVQNSLWSHAVVRDANKDSDSFTVDFHLFNEKEELIAEMALRFRHAKREVFLQAAQDPCKNWLYEMQWQATELAKDAKSAATGIWLLLADRSGIAMRLAQQLRNNQQKCVVVFVGEQFAWQNDEAQINPAMLDHWQRLYKKLPNDDLAGIVHLWSLDSTTNAETSCESLLADQVPSCCSTLYLLQSLAKKDDIKNPRLYLVTRGSQSLDGASTPNISQAPLWGLGKVIALEHPDLHCVNIDLDNTDTEAVALYEELQFPTAEAQVMFRNQQRYVGRLLSISSDITHKTSDLSNEPVQLDIAQRGSLDNLSWKPMIRRAPGPGEIEIHTHATGLNFRDVLNALGMYPGDPGALGMECSGTIVAVGEGVNDLQIGDEVLAFAAGFRSFVTIPSQLAALKPASINFEEAVTIPATFLTAYYALNHLAKITTGDKILIHAGAGGVGLAAIQLAKRAGAEIFATAGNPKKRDFLRSLGIQHVMDSRSLEFAEEIMQTTNGEGVDIVLNSLSGDFIAKSLSVLKDDGRFLEIGKGKIWTAEQVAEAKKDVSYFTIALDQLATDEPTLIRDMLEKLMVDFGAGKLRPLVHRTFSQDNVEKAFRYMAQARHIGKIVISSNTSGKDLFQADGTYLITGGSGGIGLQIARWMVDQGVRHLVLSGRKSPSTEAREVLQNLEKTGAEVSTVQADVTNSRQMEAVIGDIQKNMPPLRGIIHAAGILNDGILLQQTWQRFVEVMAAKIQGAWNLHHLTQDIPLDFFVMFSSVASTIGSPGQANYAAANAFLDTLAHYRKIEGLPATTINWGPWQQTGMTASWGKSGERQWTKRGIDSIPPLQAIQVLQHILVQNYPHVAVIPAKWSKFIEQFAGNIPPFFSELLSERQPKTDTVLSKAKEFLQKLKAADHDEQKRLLAVTIRNHVHKCLGLDTSHPIDERQPLNEIGLDSLMAVELVNNLGVSIEHSLPATLIFDYPTIESLVEYIGSKVLSLETFTTPRSDPKPQPPQQQAKDAKLKELSEEEAEALLAEKLKSLE